MFQSFQDSHSIKRHGCLLLLIAWFVTVCFSGFGERIIAAAPDAVKTYTVLLTESGFTPHEIRIPQHATVTFSTIRNASFWPASDLHPSHTIYPEFDAKESIDKDRTWSFQFDRIGIWGYHDHLEPQFAGNIIVEAKQSTGKVVSRIMNEPVWSAIADQVKGLLKTGIDFFIPRMFKSPLIPSFDTTITSFGADNKVSGDQALRLQREIISTIHQKGISFALSMVAKRAQEDPSFHTICHDLMHIVGREAYQIYDKGGHIPITPDASVCAFGFYHGMMEAWVATGGDRSKAISFCTAVDSELKKQTSNSYYQCWHGIGHGAVVPHDRKLWGNIDAMAAPALRICKDVAVRGDPYLNCVTGVYGGIAVFIMEGEYGLDLQTRDVLSHCDKKNTDPAKQCVGGLMPAVFKQMHHDMIRTWQEVKLFSDKNVLPIAANALASTAVFERVPESEIRAGCEMLDSKYIASCLDGLKTTKAVR